MAAPGQAFPPKVSRPEGTCHPGQTAELLPDQAMDRHRPNLQAADMRDYERRDRVAKFLTTSCKGPCPPVLPANYEVFGTIPEELFLACLRLSLGHRSRQLALKGAFGSAGIDIIVMLMYRGLSSLSLKTFKFTEKAGHPSHLQV